MNDKPWIRQLNPRHPISVKYHIRRLLDSKQWSGMNRGANAVRVIPLVTILPSGDTLSELRVCPGKISHKIDEQDIRYSVTPAEIADRNLYFYIDSLAMGMNQAGHQRWRWSLDTGMEAFERFYFLPTHPEVVLTVQELEVMCMRQPGEEDGSIGSDTFSPPAVPSLISVESINHLRQTIHERWGLDVTKSPVIHHNPQKKEEGQQ